MDVEQTPDRPSWCREEFCHGEYYCRGPYPAPERSDQSSRFLCLESAPLWSLGLYEARGAGDAVKLFLSLSILGDSDRQDLSVDSLLPNISD